MYISWRKSDHLVKLKNDIVLSIGLSKAILSFVAKKQTQVSKTNKEKKKRHSSKFTFTFLINQYIKKALFKELIKPL